jgi:signal transduction histidine kinase
MSAGFGLGLAFAAVFVVGTPLYFIFLHMSPSGGSADVLPAVQDAVYSFLFSATFISVVHLLRLRARQQDEANTRAQEQAVAEATQEAIENERLYLASMLHDQVLGALHLAAFATSKQEQLQAKAFAQSAILQLKNTQEWPSADERRVSTDSLFSALAKTLAEQAPNFTVSTSSVGNQELPLDVATAFTEATMQAVNNSQIHAGGTKVPRHVSLKSGKSGVKVVVSDEGRGFRMSRIPKNRIGIKTLIIRRMESVGGKARIDSDRGQGANIILEWHANG